MNLDLSVLGVIVFVLLATFLLNTLLFKPLLEVIRKRESAVESARALAQTSKAEAASAAAEFEARVTAARGEVYRQMDDTRRDAMARRAELLAQTRDEANAQVAEASARLRTDAEDARARLSADAEALGAAIVDRVLDRKVP